MPAGERFVEYPMPSPDATRGRRNPLQLLCSVYNSHSMFLAFLVLAGFLPLLITPGLLFHFDVSPKTLVLTLAAAIAACRWREIPRELNAFRSSPEGRTFIALSAATLTVAAAASLALVFPAGARLTRISPGCASSAWSPLRLCDLRGPERSAYVSAPGKVAVLQTERGGLIGVRNMRRNRPALFKGRHFDAQIIVLCVRWYLRFGLSFRDLEEIMAERRLHCGSCDDLAVGTAVCAGTESALPS